MIKIIRDVTMTIHEGMQTFASVCHPLVEITQMGRHGIENRETRKIVMGTHTGTHIDAPRHFLPGGSTVDLIDLEVLCGPALLVDLSFLEDRYAVSEQKLAEVIGDMPCERLILRFDWDQKTLMTRRYYADHPFLTEGAAEFIIDRGIKLLAMDTPQPDNPLDGSNSPDDARIHKKLLGNGVIILEYLVNLHEAIGSNVEIFALPLKIQGGDGAPARCILIDYV